MTITTTSIGVPGITLPGTPMAPRPDRLRLAVGDLLAGATPDRGVTLVAHRRRWGNQPLLSATGLAACAEAVALLGAGGAAFPTHRKLMSLASRRVDSVVVNGSEGEPASAKDSALLRLNPHLVMDGALAVTHALSARRAVIVIPTHRSADVAAVSRAIAERDDAVHWSLATHAGGFVAGEATAVIGSLAGVAAPPADLGRPPRDPRSRLRRRHVFLSNTETFARLALATRGRPTATSLTTVSGAVTAPGVYEVPNSWTTGDLAAAAGLIGTPRHLITGGWQGTWMPWPDSAPAPLTRDALATHGGRWGVGAFVWLPEDVDARAALTAIATQLADASAGQCGPCRHGLPALARSLQDPTADVDELLGAVDGRGLCGHPTATAAAVRSALTAIAGGS